MGYRFRFIIITCLWLAFFLRVWGLDFGLPYSLHPDEHQYVDQALNWHTIGEMQVRIANPPLVKYGLILVFWAWLFLTPFQPSLEWVTNAYIFARLWSVAFGMLTIAVMYPLGKRLHSRKAGVLGVLLLTGLFLPARESHFAVNDTVLTFFALLAVYFSLKMFKPGGTKYYVMAGLAVGLAAGTKLTGAVTLSVLLAAHIFTVLSKPGVSIKMMLRLKLHRNLWIAFLVFVATFLTISAPVFWRFANLVAEMLDLVELGTQSARGGVLMGPATGWQFYIDVLGWGIGWAMFMAALIALGYVFFKRWPEGIILSALPIMLFVFMGAQKLFTARYLLPAVPLLVALVAVGLAQLEIQWYFFRRHRAVLWPVIVVVLVAQPLSNLIWFDHLLTLPNTQQIATEWFVNNYPKDTVVVKEVYSILPDVVYINKHWPYKLIGLDTGDQTQNGLNHYLSHKTEIITVSNYRYGRVRQDPIADEIRLKQLELLDEKATLVKEFNPYVPSNPEAWFYQDQLYGPAGETLQRILPGPLIKIYELPYENQPYTLDRPDIPVPVNANFGNKMLLLGYDLPHRRADPGGSLPLTLYWQPLTRMSKTYVIFNHLLDDQQQNWGGYDRWPQETSNTTLLVPDEVIVDTFNLPVFADAPAGIYTIDLGLYDQADPTASPLPLWRDGDLIEQNSIEIGSVKIDGPPPGVILSSQEILPQQPLAVELGQPPVIKLKGYDLSSRSNELSLTLYWESLAQTPQDWSIFVHLRNDAGETVAQKDGPAGGTTAYPTSLWDQGEIIADEMVIPVADELPSGQYTLVVGLYNLIDGVRLTVPDSTNNEIVLSAWDLPQP